VKAALAPIPRTAVRDVAPQREGFAVEVPTPKGERALFCCDIAHATNLGGCMWLGGAVGFCRADGPVKVWTSRYSAEYAREKTGGKLVTVPRKVGEIAGGDVLTWEPVP
jgi:hypothetical protein